MELMSHGISAQSARNCMRTFMSRVYPDSKEGHDFRIPGKTMLKKWRRMLEPICHYMALSAMNKASLVHLLFDASSKRHVGIFHVTTRLEFGDGLGGSIDIPVKFKITRDGTSSINPPPTPTTTRLTSLYPLSKQNV